MHKTKEIHEAGDRIGRIISFFKSRLPQNEKLRQHKVVQPGTTIEDSEGRKYLLLEPLGDGLKGIVYKSFDLDRKTYVAIKFLLEAYKEDIMSRRMFSIEFDLLKKLSNTPIPGVVKVFGNGVVDSVDEIPFFVMEYLNGLSLTQMLKERGKISFRQAMRIGLGVATILENIHTAGIIHRDIKPSHIFINKEPEGENSEEGLTLKSIDIREEVSIQSEWKNLANQERKILLYQPIILIDFGFAIDTKYGSDNLVLGTPEYMAPELFRGESNNSSIDLYALGIVIYKLIFGKTPFNVSHDLPVLELVKKWAHMHQKTEPHKIQIEHEIPEEIWRIIQKALAKRLQDRYLTATEMRIDIENYLDEVIVT